MGIRAERAAKAAVVVLCEYESDAITAGLFPTVSQLCRRHRWIEAVLLAVLLWHLHLQAGGDGTGGRTDRRPAPEPDAPGHLQPGQPR